MTVVISWALGTVSVFLIGFSTNYYMLVSFMILTGITLWNPMNLTLIMVNE